MTDGMVPGCIQVPADGQPIGLQRFGQRLVERHVQNELASLVGSPTGGCTATFTVGVSI